MILLVLAYLQYSLPLEILTELSTKNQIFCNFLFNEELIHRSLYQALACGTRVQNYSEFTKLLKENSLWHLFVVSAGHFYALKWMLSRLPFINTFFLHFILFFFCFWTGFQEPAILAWVCGLLQLLSKKKNLNLKDYQITFYGGVLSLILFSHWTSSLSLILSWTCRLIVNLTSDIKSHFIKAVLFFALLLPLLYRYSFISSQSVIWNLLLGPFLGFILFPLSIGVMIAPQIVGPLAELLMNNLYGLLKLYNQPTTNEFIIPNIHQSPFNILLINWTYLIFIQVLTYLKSKLNL